MGKAEHILDVVGLTKTFENGQRVLDGLTFSVGQGTIFGFLGLNGSGKTTTIRIIAGLTRKDKGAIRFRGETVGDRDSSWKKHVGFVLDEPLYFDWMSAREYLNFVGTMYGLTGNDVDVRVQELLEFFDLQEMNAEPIETFSTGMKKKISLAAAIIHKPELLILDEPFESVDALAVHSLRESLLMMASRGATIFITSHVLDTVERLCDDIAIIHRGNVIVQCPTKEIRKRAKSALVSETYSSLEELFVDLVSKKVRKKHFSWI